MRRRALRLIAERLALGTLRPAEYTAERERIVADDERHWAHRAGLRRTFPTADQIEQRFRTDDLAGWERALKAAGLAPRSVSERWRGLSLVEAFDLFVDANGWLPGFQTLEKWVRDAGVAVEAQRAPAADYHRLLRERRDTRGAWTPDRVIRRVPVAELELDHGPKRLPRHQWMDLENLIEGVVRAYDIAAAGGIHYTQRAHQRLAREHTGAIPTASTVDRVAKLHGRTADWVRNEAQRRRTHRRRGSPVG